MRTCLPLVVLFALYGAARGGDAVELRFCPERGQTLHFVTRYEQERTTLGKNPAGGKELELRAVFRAEQDFTLRFLSRDDAGGARAELQFTRVRGSITLPGFEPYAFDSESPVDLETKSGVTGLLAATARLRSAHAGRTYPIAFDGRGRVIRVEGYAAAMRAALRDARAAAPELETQLAAGDAVWTDEHAARVLRQLFIEAPGRPLTLGASYAPDGGFHVCTGGSNCLDLASEISLESVDADGAQFALAGVLRAVAGEGGATESGPTSGGGLRPTCSLAGEARVDRADGLPWRIDLTIRRELRRLDGRVDVLQIEKLGLARVPPPGDRGVGDHD